MNAKIVIPLLLVAVLIGGFLGSLLSPDHKEELNRIKAEKSALEFQKHQLRDSLKLVNLQLNDLTGRIVIQEKVNEDQGKEIVRIRSRGAKIEVKPYTETQIETSLIARYER